VQGCVTEEVNLEQGVRRGWDWTAGNLLGGCAELNRVVNGAGMRKGDDHPFREKAYMMPTQKFLREKRKAT
jgi:hypothetical protein